jgi:hypothetical protein
MNRARHLLAASIALTALLASAACSGHGKPATTPTPGPSTSTTSSSTSSSPRPPAPAAKNPYTGIGPVPKTPTIAVKIDDTDAGRPQLNVDKADIVFVEAVEGGLTRLAAVYGTNKPYHVGYVRSTRPSDPDLLLQFGKITEAYSGGAHDSLPRVRRSGITSWSNDAGAPFYSRSPHANDHGYINVVLNLHDVAQKTKSALPKSIGWTFNPSLKGLLVHKGTDVRTTVTGSYRVGAGTPVEFRWDPKLKRYVRYISGVRQVAADGHAITATNVIVQSCKVVSHPQDRDVLGNPSQFTVTVGQGPVSVFRQGKRVFGTWSRPNLKSGTKLRTTGGKPLPLNPGNTWVVLVRKGVAVSG